MHDAGVEATGLGPLRDAEGQRALTVAASLLEAGDDPLSNAAAMRAEGFAAPIASAALTQARLRKRARAKVGDDADAMFFTAAGLEQATRRVVADRRAHRLASSGVRRIADLGCGIGADMIALARAGLQVLAVDADPVTAEIAAANARSLGLADRIEVRCADATTVDLSGVDAVFCDPARRATGATRERRIFDPAAYSPPWAFVRGLPDRIPATVIKAAPGFDHASLPEGAEAEWVSVGGDLVEMTLWCGPLARVPRRATVLRDSAVHEITGTGTHTAPVGDVGRYLIDPDAAVLRARLLGELAESVDGRLADHRIAYLFTDSPAHTPFARCFEVREQLPFGRKHLRVELRRRGIGRLEIRKRGVAVDPDQLRRDLRLSGPGEATLVLARFGQRPTALLCRAVPR